MEHSTDHNKCDLDAAAAAADSDIKEEEEEEEEEEEDVLSCSGSAGPQNEV